MDTRADEPTIYPVTPEWRPAVRAAVTNRSARDGRPFFAVLVDDGFASANLHVVDADGLAAIVNNGHEPMVRIILAST